MQEISFSPLYIKKTLTKVKIIVALHQQMLISYHIKQTGDKNG